MRTIDWYFDFVSPFAYLQAWRLALLPRGTAIAPKPVLFAGLLNHWGGKGPAEIPPKRLFSYRYMLWQARRLDIPMRLPPAHPFNPLKALRLAIALGNSLDAIQTIFTAIWRDGFLPDNPDGWRRIVAALGVADADALIERPEVKAALRANGEAAIAAGVFGVPTLMIDGRLFWGNDATEMAVDYIEHPELFDDPDMRRIERLPIAAQRTS
jgi:2-hydroxychromene-2-carboxylate isomerase